MSISSHIPDVPNDDEIRGSEINDAEESPTRVLLVDADSSSLLTMTNLMTRYSYQVTKYENGEEAIDFLKKNKREIDLVIWDFHMPDISGLEALDTVGKKKSLPVIIMSHDHKRETVMESLKHGACDFLVKPVSKEVIAVIWRHAKRRSKSRMKWTPELHGRFVAAIEKVGGLEKAVPKEILKCMQEETNVEGLTKRMVSSHLQNHRIHCNNNTSITQETRVDIDLNAPPI